MPVSKLTPEEWANLRAEWVAGTLSLAELSRQFNITRRGITKKAETGGWPPRNKVTDVVKSLVPAQVTGTNEQVSSGTSQTRVALQAFDRVVKLLRLHRKDLGTLHGLIMSNVQAVADIVNARHEKGGRMTLKERQMVADILAKSANAMGRLVPLERRAFGLSTEEISEFDAFTNDQLEALENTVRRALD